MTTKGEKKNFENFFRGKKNPERWERMNREIDRSSVCEREREERRRGEREGEERERKTERERERDTLMYR